MPSQLSSGYAGSDIQTIVWEIERHLSNIVEFAAWIIVWKTIFDAVQGRRRRIECKAAKAEYEDSHTLEDKIDETQPKWMQERTRESRRERQRQLLMRYPEALVARPHSRYYRQVEQEARDEKTPFKENLRENWKWWLLSAGMALGGYMLIQLVKVLWASV